MPTSIDPQPAEDEVECARCGAIFYYGLTRCPNCGVNLYEPEEDILSGAQDQPAPGLFARLQGFIRRITRKPYPVEDLFGAAIDQAVLFGDLLNKVGGDRAAAERLVEFERERDPRGNRLTWLKRAIERWKRDNKES